MLTASIANRRWVFLAFLAVLHLVFLQGPATPLGRLLFLSHIGLGLLWQPFIQPRRKIGFGGTALVVVCATLAAYFMNWGGLVLWTMLLTGVVGGKVFLFPNRWERIFHLLALGYLALLLLALVLPRSLGMLIPTERPLDEMVLYLAPTVFVVMAVLPAERGPAGDRAEIVDYVYGVLVFLLLAVIVLGSLSFTFLFQTSYFGALTITLALVAGILLLLGFIWDPRAGFGGLGSAVAQHVISLGLPIENWLEALAELSEREEDPERFLARACEELPERLPGVVGGRWELPGGSGAFGATEGQRESIAHGDLRLELLCNVQLSPTLRWHHDLAVRLLAEFYMGKWRAEELKRLCYVEAVHETGARLTHDVKNLLQSLEALCAASMREGEASSARFHELLRRQLPEVAARLRQTLGKLSAPGQDAETSPAPAPAAEWFASLRDRYAGDWIRFRAKDDLAACLIADPALFSSIAENLLQNVIEKRRAAPRLRAEVSLRCAADGHAVLEVGDDGTAVAAPVAAVLFAQRAPSENGLGIGLYQSARYAEERGYRLALAENRDGHVRFRLAPADQAGVAG
jgi:signal transduction histidine kinase